MVTALKMGYFYWLRVKNSNHLHTELSLDYLKEAKIHLESKASFIHISSIASIKPFLIAWSRECCTFSNSSVVSLKSSPWPKYTQCGTVFQKKITFLLSNFFPASNMFYIRLLANTPTPPPKKKRKIGGHRARLIEKEHLFCYRA